MKNNRFNKTDKTSRWMKLSAMAFLLLSLFWSTAFAAGATAPAPAQAQAPSQSPAVVDITLDQAVSMALVNNSIGKIAVFDYEAAKGSLTSARSFRWPTVDGAHTDARTMPGEQSNLASRRGPFDTFDRYTNSVTASWLLWTGNSVESQISQAKLALDSRRWGVAQSRQQLKFNATTAYFNFMASRDDVKLNQEAVERLERYLVDVRLQFDVGVVAKVDVLRSEVALAQARQTLIEAQNGYNLNMANLNNVVGLPLTTELRIKADMTYDKFEQDLATCVDAALRQRPEIWQATDSAKAAKEGVTIARSGYLPTVSAQYQAGWFDNSFAGTNNYNWTVFLSTNFTFLDSGLTAGKVKVAVEGFNKAKEQLTQTLDNVRLDVRSAYLSLRSFEQSIQTSSAAVGLAEEDYKIKVIRYQAGVGTNLDVLDAQLALTTAKNNYLQSMYNYNTFRAQLDKSMGVPVK